MGHEIVAVLTRQMSNISDVYAFIAGAVIINKIIDGASIFALMKR